MNKATKLLDENNTEYELADAEAREHIGFEEGVDIINYDDKTYDLSYMRQLADMTKAIANDTNNLQADQEADEREITSLKQSLDNKLDVPSDTPTIGKVLKIKAVNDDGSFVCEWANVGSGSDLDVQIEGKSIVDDGIANIPRAIKNTGKLGLVEIHDSFGISHSGNTTTGGKLSLYNIQQTHITKRQKSSALGYGAITTQNFDIAVKAAMCDGIGNEWTAEEQAAAQQRIGIYPMNEEGY